MLTSAETTGQDSYADMVDQTATDFRVRTRIYTDPAVFQDEMRFIYEKTWVYVAHESEVANHGDYRTTNIGRQPVIVSRDEAGTELVAA